MIIMFRKRCMDLVSFETRQEYDWVKGFIDGGVNIANMIISLIIWSYDHEYVLIWRKKTTTSWSKICKGALFLDVWTQVQFRRLRQAWVFPKTGQRLVLVGEPGSPQSNQWIRFPRLVRHWRLQPTEASAWQQRTDPAGSSFSCESFSILTILSRTVSLSRAWRCWTTSTATGSSGTTSGATTRSRSSARTWRAISSLPDRPSPISASPEGISNLQSSLCCYLLFVLFMTLLIIQQWKADQVGTIPKYDKGKYTFSKSLKTLTRNNLFRNSMTVT